MKNSRHLLVSGLGFLLSGCVSLTPAQFQVKHTEPSKSAKIFLVAGSHDSANFAQEILDQKKVWLAKGFTEDDINCYYAPPCEHSLAQDATQYQTLAPQLAQCYPASPIVLRKHLADAARQNPSFIYLYVSSHGDVPIKQLFKEFDGIRDQDLSPGVLQTKNILVGLRDNPEMDQFRMKMDAVPAATPMHAADAWLKVKQGRAGRDIFLSPSSLTEMLKPFPKTTKKYVVLQGCFTGGFLKAGPGEKKADLETLSELTVITASSADRTSFGCNAESQRTYFGGSIHQALLDEPGSPLQMNWPKIYLAVRTGVAARENELALPPSNPIYFTNVYTATRAPISE